MLSTLFDTKSLHVWSVLIVSIFFGRLLGTWTHGASLRRRTRLDATSISDLRIRCLVVTCDHVTCSLVCCSRVRLPPLAPATPRPHPREIALRCWIQKLSSPPHHSPPLIMPFLRPILAAAATLVLATFAVHADQSLIARRPAAAVKEFGDYFGTKGGMYSEPVS